MPAPVVAAAAGIAKKKVAAKIVKAVIAVLIFALVGTVLLGMALSQTAGAICDDVASGLSTGGTALPATYTGSTPGDPDADELARFMYAKRMAESGGDYTIQSQWSTASGAYQYIDSTWNSPAHAAIWGRYGNFPRAYMAPPAVQDEVARGDFVAAWRTYGNWAQVAMSHYVPAWTNDPSKWDTVPGGGGNSMTLRQYAEHVLRIMQQSPDFPPGTDAATVSCRGDYGIEYTGDGTAGSMAVAAAVKYIGIGYMYAGGRVAGQERLGMDCSGFTYSAYRDIGIQIGGWTGTQISDGISVGKSLSNARPGDLIITGYEPNDTAHVLMYYRYENGQHLVLESNGAGDSCTAVNPVYGSNPRCRGIGPPHPYADNRAILDIRRVACGVDANGNAVPCGAAAAAA